MQPCPKLAACRSRRSCDSVGEVPRNVLHETGSDTRKNGTNAAHVLLALCFRRDCVARSGFSDSVLRTYTALETFEIPRSKITALWSMKPIFTGGGSYQTGRPRNEKALMCFSSSGGRREKRPQAQNNFPNAQMHQSFSPAGSATNAQCARIFLRVRRA